MMPMPNITAENGEAKVAIGNEGNETWSVLLEQENLSLAKGVVYELSFAARSTQEREAEITVENAQYTRYFSEVFTLSDQMQQYTYEFTMPVDDIAAFKMLLGKNASSPVGAHDVFIDNVVLKVKDAPSQQETPSQFPHLELTMERFFKWNSRLVQAGGAISGVVMVRVQ